MSQQQRLPHPLEIKSNFSKSITEASASMELLASLLAQATNANQQLQSQLQKTQNELDSYTKSGKELMKKTDSEPEAKIKVNSKKS